jgi:hypothetical protein
VRLVLEPRIALLSFVKVPVTAQAAYRKSSELAGGPEFGVPRQEALQHPSCEEMA